MRGADAFRSDGPPQKADPAATTSGSGRAPLLPRLTPHRDHVLGIMIVLSLLVHATVILPSLLRDRDPSPPPPPKEIPVEVVQLPPKPAPQPKPPPPKPAPSKPPQPKSAQRQPPAPAKPKPPEPPKPRAAQKRPDPPKPAKTQQASKPPQSTVDRMRSLLPIATGAIAMPGSSSSGTDIVSYEDLVLSKVAKAKDESRHKGDPAAATVAFLLDDHGGVAAVMITQPSGNAWLDAEAIAMIRRGAPYPPPPPGAKRDFQVTLTLHRI